MLDISAPLPTLDPQTLYSFYPYTLSARSYLHSTLLASSSSSNSSSSSSGKSIRGEAPPNPLNEKSEAKDNQADIRQSLSRAETRALLGRRPAGIALGREDEQVSLDEEAFDAEQRDVDMFGHRFLLPFGRRLTQMEMDAAPSPSPSDPEHERRQEDQTMRSMQSPLPPEGQAQGEDGEGDEEVDGPVDLDASIEDLDASNSDFQESMEE